MNIACIPYHDWRKITSEGARTRDSHIMSHLMKNQNVDNLIIINRPISLIELYLKKSGQLIDGELLFSYKNCRLYRIKSGVYLIDFISKSLLGPVLKKKKWFFDIFESEEFDKAYNQCITFLNIKIDIIFSQNIFAAHFVKKFPVSVFDGWDNFLLFPENKSIAFEIKLAYQTYATYSTAWTTNAVKNMQFYENNYKPKKCLLIKNGVDLEAFALEYNKQPDLSEIKGPIVGFGGKITHLFNFDFFNHATSVHTDKSFVVVGQILDKDVFSKIIQRPNVHYLGDKHYDIYKSYVTNFDIGIVPYVSDHLEHGADSIKMYEYLASGLSVVGTPGAGMLDMSDFIFIANTKEEFSTLISEALLVKGQVTLAPEYTWHSKADALLELFKSII